MCFSRRQFIQSASIASAFAATTTAIGASSYARQQTSEAPMSADEALALLKEGNLRFVAGKLNFPHTGKEWLKGLVKGQAPFATILGCSDSRVPPELLFDQGFGDLFVIRVAGNVVDTDVEGSVEYSVDHCLTKLVVVMGHEGCGAVTAALKASEDVAKEPNEIQRLVKRVTTISSEARKGLTLEAALALSVEENVRASVRSLRKVPDIARAIQQSGVKVVGCVYDIGSGKVEFLNV